MNTPIATTVPADTDDRLPEPDAAARLPVRVVLLTNEVPSYRVSTVAALAARIASLTVMLSFPYPSEVLETQKISVQLLRTLRLPVWRRHVKGYIERSSLHLPLSVVAALRSARPDYILASELGLRTALALRYRRRAPGCRVIVHADLSEGTEQGRGRLRMALRRMLLRQVDWVVVNGASGERYIRSLGFPPERISQVPYATDVERFDASGRERFASGEGSPLRLLYVGRLIELKGIERFIAALCRTLAERPDQEVILTLAGDGDRRVAIESIALPANLRLRLLGPMPYDELPAVYAEADVFAFPSLGDTWGLVVNEAMASGVPVLGSVHAQAVAELVRDGHNGWQFDPLSDASVDAALRSLFTTPPQRRRQMGECAREAALSMAPPVIASRLIDTFRRSRPKH
jgi:glycosyltransferase involved in cell wall biosynthesis